MFTFKFNTFLGVNTIAVVVQAMKEHSVDLALGTTRLTLQIRSNALSAATTRS